MDVNIAALAAVEHGFKTFEIEARKIVEQQGVFECIKASKTEMF